MPELPVSNSVVEVQKRIEVSSSAPLHISRTENKQRSSSEDLKLNVSDPLMEHVAWPEAISAKIHSFLSCAASVL